MQEEIELDITIPSPETDGSLSHFTVSILTDNLFNQINNSEITENPNNFLEDILLRFNYLANKHSEEGDILKEINNTRYKVLEELASLLISPLNIQFDDIFESTTVTNLENSIAALYNFLIISRFDNTVNFIVNYIFENKVTLAKYFKANTDRKDFDLQTQKKLFSNYDESILIHQLDNIISYILEEDHNQEDFLSLMFMNEETKIYNIIITDMFELTELSNVSIYYFSYLKKDSFLRSSLNSIIKSKLTEIFKRKE